MVKVERIKSVFMGAIALVGAVVFASLPQVAAAYTGVEYDTTAQWTVGTVVSVDEKGELVPASVNSADYLGVVAQPSTGTGVEVADSGTVTVLVSDVAGQITGGSRIGLSTVSGIAAAWTGGVAIGVAQQTPSAWRDASLENGETVKVASVTVQLLTDGASSDGSPVSMFFSALERTASGVAGKPVDTWRVVTALLIGLGGLILAFGLLFISSRESFFSMGRNPMASKMIMRGLWKMVALSVGILVITLTAAYLIVRVG